MTKQHKHAELIKAWADGAVIEGQGLCDMWVYVATPDWKASSKYRIAPTCDYALSIIEDMSNDHTLDLYIYWLAGGELSTNFVGITGKLPAPSDDPFNEFTHAIRKYSAITKKKTKIKQVMWVCSYSETEAHVVWLEEGCENNGSKWHKVPSVTREVER